MAKDYVSGNYFYPIVSRHFVLREKFHFLVMSNVECHKDPPCDLYCLQFIPFNSFIFHIFVKYTIRWWYTNLSAISYQKKIWFAVWYSNMNININDFIVEKSNSVKKPKPYLRQFFGIPTTDKKYPESIHVPKIVISSPTCTEYK